MSEKRIILGSRGSDLALYQANFIKSVLETEHGYDVEIKIIKTIGDKIDHLSFDKMEGKGFFTKEIEDALLAKEIDLAVHSLKDLMTTQPDGLSLGAVGYRADCRELLLIRKEAFTGSGFLPIKNESVVGTSSARRQCQLYIHNRSLKIKDLRGNVPTRINKLREGQYDAIVLAAAGVHRLELDVSDLEIVHLDPEQFLPCPAQGILGLQIRTDDNRVVEIINKLNCETASIQARIERGLLSKFDSGCTLPLGVYSEIGANDLRLKAILGIRDKDSWSHLEQVDIKGDNPEDMVQRAFARLTGG